MSALRFTSPDGREVVLKVWLPKTVSGLFLLGFLGVWLGGWTVGCVLMLLKVPEESWGFLLFAIPFWVAEVGVSGLWIGLFLRRARVVLNSEGLTVTESAFRTRTRFVSLGELKAVTQKAKIDSNYKKNFHLQIQLRSGETFEVQCSELLLASTRADFVSECASFLSRSAVTWGNSAPAGAGFRLEEAFTANSVSSENFSGDDDSEEDVLETVSLRERGMLLDQSSESLWIRDEQAGVFAIFCYEKFSFVKLFSILGFCLFWNGIVSVFVLSLFGVLGDEPPKGLAWWGLFAFLIPFEVIGFCAFLAVIKALLAPHSCTRWELTRSVIRYSSLLWGFGRRRTVNVSGASEIRLCQQSAPSKASGVAEPILLEFWDADGNFLDEIGPFTLSDARWIASRFHSLP